MLTTEQFNEWLAALRSGTYVQVQCALEIDGGFCCLGVLADLNKVNATSTYSLVDQMDLPAWFVAEAVEMNDIMNWSFDRIADELEKQRAQWVLDPTN